ncbi:MAG: PIN domain-containing protein [Deltaproteobacteria bacterium]|nr:PIN domain-containing protein [Deltaproteobacteria bacterium]
MRLAFVDTSAWFIFFVANDPDRRAVAAELPGWEGRLLTSDYVFDELVTLLRYRAGHREAIEVGNALRDGSLARLIALQPQDLDQAWRRFGQERDKRYSFTDCTSFAAMSRLGLDTAFATDEHFRQAGFTVLPSS